MKTDMRYHPNAEQMALASTFNESLAALLPLSRLHEKREETAATWSSLQSLGLFGIALGEAEGGSGLGAAEEALIALELGRCLAAPAVLATMGATHASFATDAQRIARGRRTAAAYRREARLIVVGDAPAEFLLVRDGSDAALCAKIASAVPVDDRLWLDPLRESGARPERIVGFDSRGLVRLRLLDAAALAGTAEAALNMSVAYAGVRRQFGRPIGGFQAIKHHCANMAIAARCARDQVSFAAIAIDDDREDAKLQVDCALLVAGNAALENAGRNIQIHGGMGFSDEADPHLLLKRAQLLLAIAGGLEATNERIAAVRRAHNPRE